MKLYLRKALLLPCWIMALLAGISTQAQSGPTGLKATYYDNIDLTGSSITRTDSTVNFDWGFGAPDAAIGSDTFSVRWQGLVEPRYSQVYTFYAKADDGVRLWVNGQLLVDKWIDQDATEWSGSISLNAGQKYDIQMDYYENSGGAQAQLSWSSASQAKEIIPATQLTPYVAPTPLGSGTGLQGNYYDNMDFTGGQVVRVDPTVDFNWGTGSPDASIGADTFSVRWTGKVEARYTQTYTFYTTTDDGVRLWVNGQLLIDKWIDQTQTEWSGSIDLVAGQKYDIQMDYFENGGGTRAALSWASYNQAKQIIPQSQLYVNSSVPGTGTGLQAVYYDNSNFTGTSVARIDPMVNFNWGTGSPDPAIGSDTFSVRWTGKVEPRYTQPYTFYTTTDDGVRLWVNGVLLIDKWVDQGSTEWSGIISLTAGQKYDIQMDYYENGGGTMATLSWSSPSQAKGIIPQMQLYTPTNPPSITTQPQSQIVASGANVTFSVVASGTSPLGYQWRFNGINISGATTSSFVKNNVQSANIGYYSVVVSNPFGAATSTNVTLALNDGRVFTETFESGNLNNWTTPSSATGLTISTAQNHTLSGANSALTDNSQDKMYHNLNTLLEGHSKTTFWIYDSTQARILGEVRSYSGGGYNNGSVQQVYSVGKFNAVTLPGETYNSTKYQGRVLTGANPGWFNLNATGAPSRSTGWHKFEIEVLTGGTTINFYVDGVLGRQITGASYYPLDDVSIGSIGSGSTTGNAYFDDVSVDYYDLPTITTQPASQIVNAGSSVTFNVGATGNVTGYQWQKNGAPIVGATNSTLVFNNVQQASAGTYSVIVFNGIGPGTSTNATLTVIDVSPVISTQPQSQSALIGSNVTFSVVASGTDPLSYQWCKNAATISGATSTSYSISNFQSADVGNYSVVVANGLGNVTSTDAVLTVFNNPPVLGTIGSRPVNEGNLLTFTASATDADAGQTLTFSLDAGSPAGAIIDPNSGVFSWTPTEAQGPGMYPIAVRVTDDGSPTASAMQTFTVTVGEINTAPILTLGVARVEEMVVNFESITNFGNDEVMFRKPSNSGITGVFIDNGVTNYSMVVTSFPAGNSNAGAKVMKASWSFLTGTTNPWVCLTTTNSPLIPNPTIDLGARLKFDIYASKSILVGLGVRETGTTVAIGADGGVTGPIEWLGATKIGSSPVPSRSVSAGSWTTLEFNLPAEYCTNFIGGDDMFATGLGVLEHLAIVPNGGMGVYTVYLDNFSVVSTVQLPTMIMNTNGLLSFRRMSDPPPPAAVTMNTGSVLTFTPIATDADAPAQTLTYSLDAGAPAGAAINSSTGAFSWTPSVGQANTTNTIKVRVTDNGPGSSNALQIFTVIVNADLLGAQGKTSGVVNTGETITLTWNSIAGKTYQVQSTDNADSGVWIDSGAQVVAMRESTSVVVANGGGERHYRVIEVSTEGSSDE